MRVRVLGDLEVRLDGRVVDLGGPQQRALLALLVVADGRPVPTERLVDQLWGEDPPPAALPSLQAKVARLRRALEPDRPPGAAPGVLVTRPSGYALVLDEDAVDAHRFTALVQRARSLPSPAAVAEAVDEALALWAGPAYGGVAAQAPALAAEADRLEELRLAALELGWTARVDLSDPGAVVPELRRLCAEHPVRERLWGLLALALYRAGRQAEALDTLREVRDHLADELGLDPGRELRALEDAVLRHDPALRAPEPPPGGEEAPLPTPGVLSRNDGPTSTTPGEGAPATAAPLAGRADALATTADAVADVVAGHGRVVLVTGHAGIGKTRLAREVAAQAAAAGLAVGWGTWEAEGCPPLWAWRRALAAVLGDASPLEGREDDATASPDVASATFELAGAVAASVTSSGGACLVLDDLHWADADSHRLLRRIVAQVPALPLLLVVLTREEDPEGEDLLPPTLAALARAGAVRVGLGGLSAAAVADHVERVTGHAPRPEVAERLRERTDGNPFYLQELLRALAGTTAFEDDTHPGWAAVPRGVRDVVRHRVATLPPEVARVLTDAAVIGRTVEADVLEAAWDGSAEDLEKGLVAAVASGLVEEDGAGTYRFRHALVRDAVLEELTGPARTRAHARVAHALESRRVGRLDEVVPRLAEHYRLAGPAHVRPAWLHTARAAELAVAQQAHDDASRLLTVAVTLQADDPAVTDAERERVGLEHGRALRRVGRVYEGWAPVAACARAALARGDAAAAARSLLVVTENALWSWRPPHVVVPESVELWREVREALRPTGAADLLAPCTAATAVELLYSREADSQASALVDEALDVARRAGDPHLLVRVLNLAHMALHRPHHLLRRLPIGDEMVELCVRLGDDAGLAAGLWRRGVDRAERGRWAEGIADLRRSREIGRRLHLAPTVLITGYGIVLDHMARGDWAALDDAIDRNEDFEALMSMAGRGVGQAQRAAALLAQGRPEELADVVGGSVDVHPTFRDLVALSLVARGRPEDARALLGEWRDQPRVVRDYMWTSATVLRAWVWAGLGDDEAVADLRAALTPFADRLATGGMSAYLFGSVRHTLAVLAEAAGDLDTAHAEAARALEVHESLGFGPWAARTRELLERIADRKGAASAR